MTIRYTDGRNSEAVLLSRTNDTMRVVLPGNDDTTYLTQVNGAWFSENNEPVQVEFAWQLHARPAEPKLADCVCPAELASKLIDLLFDGREEPKHFAAG